MKITKQRLKKIIREELGDMHTEPRHATSSRTAKEKLLHQLLIRSEVDQAASAEEAATELGLGEDEDVVKYLKGIMGNQFLDNPEGSGLEEGWGWRAEDDDRPMTNKEKWDQLKKDK